MWSLISRMSRSTGKLKAVSAASSKRLPTWDAESLWWQRVKMMEKHERPSDHLPERSPKWQIILSNNQSNGKGGWISYRSCSWTWIHSSQYQKEQFKQPVSSAASYLNHATYHRGQLCYHAEAGGCKAYSWNWPGAVSSEKIIPPICKRLAVILFVWSVVIGYRHRYPIRAFYKMSVNSGNRGWYSEWKNFRAVRNTVSIFFLAEIGFLNIMLGHSENPPLHHVH